MYEKWYYFTNHFVSKSVLFYKIEDVKLHLRYSVIRSSPTGQMLSYYLFHLLQLLAIARKSGQVSPFAKLCCYENM